MHFHRSRNRFQHTCTNHHRRWHRRCSCRPHHRNIQRLQIRHRFHHRRCRDAVAIAVVTGIGVEARTVVVGGIGVVVAGRIIGTSSDFKLVADSITVGVSDAVSIAVVTGFGVGA